MVRVLYAFLRTLKHNIGEIYKLGLCVINYHLSLLLFHLLLVYIKFVSLLKMVRKWPGRIKKPCGNFRSSVAADLHTLCADCKGYKCSLDAPCSEYTFCDGAQWNRYQARGNYVARKTTSVILADALATKYVAESDSSSPPYQPNHNLNWIKWPHLIPN